jgi:hypothetical protein
VTRLGKTNPPFGPAHDLLQPFPRIEADHECCLARPAWQRTLGLHAELLGVSVDDIRYRNGHAADGPFLAAIRASREKTWRHYERVAA